MPTAKLTPTEFAALAVRGQTEAEFQRQVVRLAKLYQWRVVHYRPSLNRSGKWSTPVQGDKGGPDLLLAKGGKVLLLELKTEAGRLRPEQRAWQAAAGGNYWCVRPSDWGRLVEVLRGEA
jgi:hypothetical protein